MRTLGPGLLAATLILSGCAGLPSHVSKTRSEAIADPGSTSLGRLVAAAHAAKSLSGIRLLVAGDDALASRIALADHAQKTLDIQYYILDQDDSSRALLRHVRMAADRGVRVRLLVDDLNTAGEDRRLLHLSERANIEVRVFNPFPGGRSATWSKILASLSDIARINHRMHNKLFVADNALAITGGRNIGDAYFTRDPKNNFIDLDVVAAGDIVPALSATFDAFWNSRYAFPIASIASPEQPDDTAAPAPAPDPDSSAEAMWLTHQLDAGSLQLNWVPASVLADKPAKIASDTAAGEETTIANNITSLMKSAKQELIVISAYFVPGEDGMVTFRNLVAKGVKIRVLTNSLASTDSPLVHIGYSRYRAELLKLGVELYEVRPKPGQQMRRFRLYRSANAAASSLASLHAKAVVIDQRLVFIGSMNMDGRSKRFNSELGLIILSPDLAHQVTELLDDIAADDSYKLSLANKHGRIEWRSGEGEERRVWYVDPETTRMGRFFLDVLSPFAPEELL